MEQKEKEERIEFKRLEQKLRLKKEKWEKEEFETKEALEGIEQDFDKDTYIVFHDDDNGNIFPFPDNTDPLDNLAMQSVFNPVLPAYNFCGIISTILKSIGDFDRDNDNPEAMDMEFDSIAPVGVFDRDNPHQPTLKTIGVFDRDNPEVLWYMEKQGNHVSAQFSLDLAPKFTDAVPLTSDLEPDCSIYKYLIFMGSISQSFRFFSENEEFSTIFSNNEENVFDRDNPETKDKTIFVPFRKMRSF